MKWTKNQQEVIDTRGKNILVSAAAGSGKTAVLTQRILELVSCREHPVDIDQLVVVTFTRAAAGEMRERIVKALQKKAEEFLENGEEENYWYLQKQLSYVHNARITTIDSFCMEIVREHFAVLDLDPSFQIGEEGELTLLQADVMENLLEEFYQEADEDFLDFVDVYSATKSDSPVEEMIYTMYRFAISYPYPAEFLKECGEVYSHGEAFESEDFYQAFWKHNKERLMAVHRGLLECLEIAAEEDGPQGYEEALRSDDAFVMAVIEAENYEKRQKLFAGYQPVRLKTIRKGSCDEEKKEYVKAERDAYKKILKELQENYFAQTKEEVTEDLKMVRSHADVLIRLVLQFMEKYQEAKREKNLVDFSDLEHFALEILVERTPEGSKPSAVALEMAKELAEIMVDEYQDSNYVQEMILQSLSGKPYGRNNLFMVGDVKQSIYKFRMAKPELFLQKYHQYQMEGDGPDRKIILSRNFRSRKTVLQVVNLLFGKIMTTALGGIAYDENQSLFYGADYAGEDAAVELLIADTSQPDEEQELEDDVDAASLEAEMIAVRIRQLYEEKFPVRDKETGEMRPVRFQDMAILMRSLGERAELIERALKAHGIPVRCPVKKGCFASFEVENVLQFLSVIDNPRQDIPFTAVLKNIFHFTEEELAMIKIAGGSRSMYENVRIALQERKEDTKEEQKLIAKLDKFTELLQKYREQKVWMTIYDLIQEILEDTGFLYFIAAFPDGEMRIANLEMLKEKASVYQQSSYSGLFHFIRYIEKNNEYEIEQEMINGAGMSDAVTMMSIHKSKGLEYPVVFVSALAKKFNKEDTRKKILLHPDFGIGMDRYNAKRNIHSKTLVKQCLAFEINMENMAEELRVLYVALTRAKEKLILTASGKMDGKWEKYERLAMQGKKQGTFEMNQLLGAGSFLDLLLMGFYGNGQAPGIEIKNISGAEIAGGMLVQEAENRGNVDVLAHWDADYVYDASVREGITEALTKHYPYEKEAGFKAKISISERKQMVLEEEETETVYANPEKKEIIPRFAGGTEELSGAERGTAYHRVFELLDYGREIKTDRDVQAFLEELEEKGLLTGLQKDCIYRRDILKFLETDLARRMGQAWKRGMLKREQQFVMGIPAKIVYKDYEGEENILVQGMMDAYFEEDGRMCLVDYKTDYVNTKEELISRYKEQLHDYAYALEKITGCPVEDEIIYSVRLGEEISLRK